MLLTALIAAVALEGGPGTSAPQPPPPKAEAAGRRDQITGILASREPRSSKLAILTALGAEATPGLFAELCEQLDPESLTADPESRLILLEALELLDRPGVLAVLDEASRSAAPGPRHGVLAAIGAFGGRGELQLATNAATRATPEGDFDAQLIQPFERAVLPILESGSEAFGELPRLVRSAPLEISMALVRSAAEVGGEPALTTLVELLGKTDGLDATILSHLGRAARRSYRPLGDEYLLALHATLSSKDPNVVRAGLQALGQLEDASAIEACIDFLDAPSESLAQTGLWSLKHITGLDLPPTADRWRAWYRSEREWLDHESSGAFAMLRGSNREHQRRAVDLVLQHRIDRHRLAEEVSVLLESPHADLRLLAVMALRKLGSRTTVPALVTSLSDTEPDVAKLAWQTLCELTGLELPLDSDEWLGLLTRG